MSTSGPGALDPPEADPATAPRVREDGFVARAVFTGRSGVCGRPMPDSAEESIRYERGNRHAIDGASPFPAHAGRSQGSVQAPRPPERDPRTLDRVHRIRSADRVGRFETRTGVRVTGAEVLRTACPGFEVTREDSRPGKARSAAGPVRLRVGALGAPYSIPAHAVPCSSSSATATERSWLRCGVHRIDPGRGWPGRERQLTFLRETGVDGTNT